MFKLLFTILIVLISQLIVAQGNVQVTSYTVESGLPQSGVQDITQDKDGFLWIATADGLCRFDGYNFKSFKRDARNLYSPNSDWHNHFFTDSSKRLWMTSYNGIGFYDSNTDKFTSILTYETKTVVTTENLIYGEDAKYLWAGLSNYGLVRINKRTLQVEPLNIPGLKDPTDVFSWYRGFMEKGRIWIVTKTDFYIYTISTRILQKIDLELRGLINLNSRQAIGFDTKNLLLINKDNLGAEKIPLSADKTDHNLTWMVRISDNEVLLCSSSKGLLFLDVTTKKITRRIETVGTSSGRKNIQASCAYIDWSGNLWVGTSGDGLLKYNFPYRNFKLYRSDDPKSNQVFSIYADTAKVYIGVGNYGIDVFARSGKFLRNVAVNFSIPSIRNNATVTIPVGDSKLMLLANNQITGASNQPLLYDRTSGDVKLANSQVLSTHAKYWGQGNFRQFVFQASEGNYLTNTGEYLLSIKRDTRGVLHEDTVHRFAGHMLSCCFRSPDGTLWIGTYKGTFYLENSQWKQVKLPKPVEVKCILEDPYGNTWLSTGIGIYILDKKKQVTNFFTQNNYLLNEHVYTMLRDNDGNIWFSHNKGISEYIWQKRKFKHYVHQDGLQSAEFNSGAYFKASNGELFFGGINGTTSFFPGEIRDNPHAPKPLITKISVLERPYKSEQSHWNIRSISLPYTDNSLSFDFTLPEYSDPSRSRYLYTMENVDKGWINAGDRRFARYPALQPGEYVFKVKAANNNGIWSGATRIRIQIAPPFWQRAWFILLIILVFIGMISYVVSLIQREAFKKKLRAMEVQHKIQVERERISRDLHDNVGTQLSLISKNIEGVLHPLQAISEDERSQKLLTMSQTSKEVIATLRETIWALSKEEISLEEFSDKLKSFAQKQTQVYSSRLDLKYEEETGDLSVILQPSEAIHLFRICQEAIANSLKYSNASNLRIAVGSISSKYWIIIEDDGVGFSEGASQGSAHYGIENMKFRASEIACMLEIKSSEGKGTTIRLEKK